MKRPNILFILIDDLGWRDLGCYGSSFYETPHLDRLAARGIRFTDAYASSPVCSPTRASILSGKAPARVGVTQWIGGHAVGRLCDVPYFHALPLSEHSIAAALRAGGYQTWHIGKWHLGGALTAPEKHGFEVNVGGCGLGHPPSHFSPYGIPGLTDGPEGEYLTDRLTDEAIARIRARGDQPFFLHLSHYAVHTPIQAPDSLARRYRDKAREMGLEEGAAVVAGECFPCAHKQKERVQRRLFQSDATYAAMVERVDAGIGRLLDCLETEGIAGETLVIFTSDNGGLATAEGSPTCNLPLSEGKGWMYEGGTRVCQLACWPGVTAPGAICSAPVASSDFYPTFLEAAGLPLNPEQHRDGVSLMPVLRGESGFDRGALFWHYPHYSNQGGTPACSIRESDWKLIEFFEDGALELFNLREDIGETRNRAIAEPQRTRAMRERLATWRAEVEALIPKPNPNAPPPEPLPAGVDPATV